MFQRYRQLLPLLVLAAFYIGTVITAISGTVTIDETDYDFAPTIQHYGAFIMIAVSLASFFFLRRYYKYFFVLTFLLGLFGIINVTATQTTWSFGFDSLSIGLSPVLLLVGLITYLLNNQKVNSIIFALIKPSDEKIARIQQEEISLFKSKFSRKSTEELAQIVAANTLVPSALLAAKQLLKERE